MNELVGKTFSSVLMSEGNDYLVFKGTDAIVAYLASGDCCSVSWFEAITNVENLIDSEILSVESKEFEVPEDPEGKFDCLQCFGWTIKTAKGYADIEFRNDSNGYYGGEASYLMHGFITEKDGTQYLDAPNDKRYWRPSNPVALKPYKDKK